MSEQCPVEVNEVVNALDRMTGKPSREAPNGASTSGRSRPVADCGTVDASPEPVGARELNHRTSPAAAWSQVASSGSYSSVAIDPSFDDDRFRTALIEAIRFGCRHWLFAANVFLFVFSTLPVLAPILAAMGLEGVSNAIFVAYSLTCHQMPSRSFFIFGHQMAYCERNTAIYFSMMLTGMVYAGVRERGVRRLPWHLYLLLILPMAVDGFTQLFGWRESSWLLRGITGAMFGAATVWLAFPCLQQSFDEIEREL